MYDGNCDGKEDVDAFHGCWLTCHLQEFVYDETIEGLRLLADEYFP